MINLTIVSQLIDACERFRKEEFTMKEWGFYGRKQELEDVCGYMRVDTFRAVAVFGGRGYGKTKLLDKAVEDLQKEEPLGDYTKVYMELPDATEIDIDRAKYERNVRDFYNNFRPEFEKTKFGHKLKKLGIPDNGDGFFEKGFRSIINDVLKEPKTVLIIDEAQNLNDIGLVYSIKRAIDTRRLATGEKAGTLVLAGSHQQKMHKMMAADRPLGYRCQHLHLPPFNSQDLLRIGAEHGWLDRPRRFLTMYAALGGVPRLWEDFHRDCSSGKFKDPKLTGDDYTDDVKWQESFMQWRIDQLRQKPETQYLSPKYVDMPKYGEEIIGELVNTFPGISFGQLRKKLVDNGIKSTEIMKKINQMTTSYFNQGIYKNHQAAKESAKEDVEISLHKEMNKQLSKLLYTLTAELRIISTHDRPEVKDVPNRYGYQEYNDVEFFFISQPNVAFENVTKILWVKKSTKASNPEESTIFGRKPSDPVRKKIFNQLSDLEGRALENLVTDCFLESTAIKYEVISEIRGFDHDLDEDGMTTSKSPQSGPEIDLAIAWFPSEDSPAEVRVIECKRSFSKDSIDDTLIKLKDKPEKFVQNYITDYKGPYNLKAVLMTSDKDNFDQIRDKIKQIDADSSSETPIVCSDLKELAKLMKITIAPFPESPGKEAKSNIESPNSSPDNNDSTPSLYDYDDPTP